MKDSLFDLLLDLFEKTIMQLKERCPAESNGEAHAIPAGLVALDADGPGSKKTMVQVALLGSAREHSFRVITPYERSKLSKSSYQLLQRLMVWGVVSTDLMELILNRLLFSDAHIVELQETKWTVRSTLAGTCDEKQLAFLDLVLYQEEHDLSLN